MTNHEMTLNPEPFVAIQIGTQIIETRINDEKRRLIEPGDTITFFLRPNRQKSFIVEVRGKSIFLTFHDLFSVISEVDFGYPKDTTPSEMTTNMQKYYSGEEEEKYGVVGFHIKVI